MHKIWLTVIGLRQELIAFYQHRGYVRTSMTSFPFDNGKEVMLVGNLQFEEMKKSCRLLSRS
ncbi:MAG: hypothetical protein Q7R66_20485 [Undibacterium sp.]|uniref:hypothetical protein n=1 Tax=Undibacterium sp. TaxID=1914977 RepID=UPI00271E915E|nr:hypothetical protein [Undibacterium sp.]MDO8654556.1 hypothetical protein [Undibacterium sp.]